MLYLIASYIVDYITMHMNSNVSVQLAEKQES